MSGSESGRSYGGATFQRLEEKDCDGQRSRIYRKWSRSVNQMAGLAAQTMSLVANRVGRSPPLGIAAATNKLRRPEARDRRFPRQQNVKILRHFREIVKKN